MSLGRDLTTVGGGTIVSRLIAYLRDAGIAALLGATAYSDALFAIMQVINFFRRLLAEGALNGAFVPISLKLRSAEDGEAGANRFSWRTLLAMLCIAGIVALAIYLLAPLLIAAVAPGFDADRAAIAVVLLRVAASYVFFAGLTAVIAAALNAERRVTAVTVSTAMFNVVMVIAVAMAFDDQLAPIQKSLVLALAIPFAALIQLLITGITWLVTGPRWRRPIVRVPEHTKEFFRRAAPSLIAAGIPQLKLIAATAIVSSSEAAVAWLYYANRLYELPLGLASVAIAAVILPDIVASRRSEAQGSDASQSRAYEIALGLALPAATGLALLATPIAAALFQHGAFGAKDTAAVAAAVTAISAGLPGHVLEKLFAAVSAAHEDTKTPMLTACCGLGAAIAGGLLLFPSFGFVGVAVAIAIAAWIGAALLGIVLYRRGWIGLDAQAARRLPRIVGACVMMGVSVIAAASIFPAVAIASGRLVAVLTLVALGVVVYAAALHVLGVARPQDLLGALRR